MSLPIEILIGMLAVDNAFILAVIQWDIIPWLSDILFDLPDYIIPNCVAYSVLGGTLVLLAWRFLGGIYTIPCILGLVVGELTYRMILRHKKRKG